MFIKRPCCCAYFGAYGVSGGGCVVGKKPLRFHGVMTNSKGGASGPEFDATLLWRSGSSWSGWYGVFSLGGDSRVLSAAGAACPGVSGAGTYSMLWKMPCTFTPSVGYWVTNIPFSLSVISNFWAGSRYVDPGSGVTFSPGGEPILNPAIDWTGASSGCKPTTRELVGAFGSSFTATSCKPMVMEIDDSEPIALLVPTSGYSYLKGSFLE